MTITADAPDLLRFPVGRYIAPAALDSGALLASRREVEALPARLREAVHGLDDAQLGEPYREGGWTVRQVVHHLADSHLNMYTRFRLALTEDAPTIKPYSESAWADLADARNAPLLPSLQIIEGVHVRWAILMDAMTDADWQRAFVHPELQRTYVLWQVAELYAWHSRHHVAHITRLRERMGWHTGHS